MPIKQYNKKCKKSKSNSKSIRNKKNYNDCMQCVQSQKCGTYSTDYDKFICGGFERDYSNPSIIKSTNGCIGGHFNKKNAIDNCRLQFTNK